MVAPGVSLSIFTLIVPANVPPFGVKVGFLHRSNKRYSLVAIALVCIPGLVAIALSVEVPISSMKIGSPEEILSDVVSGKSPLIV